MVGIEGIVPALLTPFATDGSISETILRRLTRYELDAGAKGFFVCGSAGEGIYMTPRERKRVVELVVSETSGHAAVIAHVGAISTDEAVALARDARDAGATAVASMPPLVFKQPWAAIVEHIRAVAEGSELPTYYYHIPPITNVVPTAEEFAEMADRVPGMAGIKFSSPDLFLLWGALDRPRRPLELLYGCDQQLYQGLITGAAGGIGSTYNYQIENVVGLYEACRRDDHAEALHLQGKINEVVEIVFKYGGNRAVEKAMMSLRGYNVGPPRRPNLPFPTDRLSALRQDMEEVGLI